MKNFGRLTILLPGLFLAIVLPLHAATYTWDTLADPGYQAGDGGWDIYQLSWNTDGGGENLTFWEDGNDAVFAADGASSIFSDYVTAASVTFNGSGYSLFGNTLTNNGDYIMNEDATIYSPLAGKLCVGGAKTLTISGGFTASSNIILAHGDSTQGNVVQDGGDVFVPCYPAADFSYVLLSGFGQTGHAGSYTLNSGTLNFGQGMYLGWGDSSVGVFIQNNGTVSGGASTEGIRMSLQGGTGHYYLNGGTLFSYLNSYENGQDYFYFGGGTFKAAADFDTYNGTHGVNTTIQPGATAYIDTNGHSVTWSDSIQGAGCYGLAKSGAGTLTLKGINTYEGTTIVSDGVLRIANASALPGYDVSGRVVTVSTGLLAASVGGAGEWTAADIVVLLANVDCQSGWAAGIDTTSGDFDFTEALGGDTQILKLGTNVLTLSATNTFDGGTFVKNGTVKVTNSDSLGQGPVTTGWEVIMSPAVSITGGSIDLNGCTVGNEFILHGAGAFDGVDYLGAIYNSSATPSEITGNVTIDAPYIGGYSSIGDIELSGVVSGPSNGNYSLLKQGNTTLTLSGTENTFDGFVYIEQGVLEVTKLANLGQPSSLGQPMTAEGNVIKFSNYYTTHPSGQTLRYIGDTASSTDRSIVLSFNAISDNILDASGTTSAASVTFTGDVVYTPSDLVPSTVLTLTGDNMGDNTVAGDISGPVSVVKTGSGKWVLSGVKSYTGDTTVDGGTLVADSIVNSPNVTVLSGQLTAQSIVADTLTIGATQGNAAAVPEPSMLALLAVAGLGMVFVRRHRND